MAKLVWSVLLPALLVAWMYAWGHDSSGNAATTAWLMEQHSNSRAWCCDGKDAQYLNENEWGIEQGHYFVIINGLKMSVDDKDLVKPTSPNPTGTAILWYVTTSQEGYVIRCFIPGTET